MYGGLNTDDKSDKRNTIREIKKRSGDDERK